VGLSLGNMTASVPGPLATGTVIDTNPPAGTVVKAGAVITYRASVALTYDSFQLPSHNDQYHGLVAGPDGNVWATEYTANKIARVTPEGHIDEFNVPTANSGPFSIAVGPDGNLWFTENLASKVARITPTGRITEFPTPTPNAGPAGISGGSDGNVWFAESFNSAVARVTPAGQVIELKLPTPNASPFPVALGADGNIYVSETTSPVIDKITPGGSITPIQLRAGATPATLLAPGPDGTILYGRLPSVVGVIQSNGTVEESASFPITGLCIGPDGFTWVSDNNYTVNGPGEIVSFDSHAQKRATINVDMFDKAPVLVINGPGGMLWFIEAASGRVSRVTL
jgi:virginiamycin B lyase